MKTISQALRLLTAALLGLTIVAASRAMSVLAPSFDELVSAATTVFRGTVTDVHSVTVDTPQGSAIRTLVTFQVEHALKGAPAATTTLSFLGGKVGRRTLSVVGMPRFAVGEREIVFVGRNGNAICPVLAGGHGRYHVRHDGKTNRDFMARDNNAPLTSTDDVAKPLEPSASNSTAATAAAATSAAATSAAALSPEEFENRIMRSVHNHRPSQP